MICSKLHVKSVGGLPVRARHDTSIVDQDINLGLIVDNLSGATPDRGQRAEVQLIDIDVTLGLLGNLIPDWICLLQISTEHENLGSTLAQVNDSLPANTSVAA